MKQYYITWLLFFILVLAIFIPYRESFESQDNRNKILTSNRLNYEQLYPNQLLSIVNKAWNFVLFRLNTSRPLDIFGSPQQVIIDPLDYLNYAKQYPFQELKPGYFFVFTSPNNKDDFQCGFDMSSKKIGFFDRPEQKFIESILFGYRQTAKLVELPLDKINKLDTIWSDVDLLVLYIMPNSPYLSLIQKQELILLDISNISIDRLKITRPYYELIQLTKTDFFNLDNRIVTPNDIITTIAMPMYLINLVQPPATVEIPVTVPISEPFITRLETSAEFKDPKFMCIGNPDATSKFQCDSPYTDQGEPKVTHNLWDKPCKEDTDCPYYRANKNYVNDFGRCMPDGKCQMPIGTMRIGYTKVYNKPPYSPFCYQCRNPNDELCCEDQSVLVARGQTRLKSPDYAFPGDTELRQLNKLPTLVSLQ